MESTDSSMGGSPPQPHLPPGFRFHPTDEELVVHYLKKKATSSPLPVSIIADVDLYKFDPWELPAKATFGEQEWYFFSPRDRKYPNGARPNRAATSGYWKATGTDKPVLTSGGAHKVGVKKALVFYGGKPPKGVKTNWIMHEYRLTDNQPTNKPPGFDPGKKNSLRLDDWVLCRIYKKNNFQRSVDGEIDGAVGSVPIRSVNFGGFVENEQNLFDMVGAGEDVPAMSLKRAMYWPEGDGGSGKRYEAEGGGHGGGMIGNLPMTAPQFQQQGMLGGEGYFRQQIQLPGMNWYS